MVASSASSAGAPAGVPGGQATISLTKQAELLARGAAVGVPVSITCTAPSVPSGQSLSQYVSVQLSEVVLDNVVQQGYGTASEFTCDGSVHTVTVYVAPGSSGGPYGGTPMRPMTDGTAFASAQLSICSLPGIILPPTAPFAAPTPLPIPSPIPSFPVPVCQSASSTSVITIQSKNEG